MINTNYSVSFKARNKEIRKADDMARRVNCLYPRISSSALESFNSSREYEDVCERAMDKVRDVRDVFDVEIDFYPDFKTNAEKVLDIIDAYRYGNCAESSFLAQIFAKINGIENTEFRRLVDEEGNNLDHSVIVVNSKRPYVIDCWLGFADYLPKAVERYNKEYRNCFELPSDDYNKMQFAKYRTGFVKQALSRTMSEDDKKILKSQYNTTPDYGFDKDYTGWILLKSKKTHPESYRTNINVLRHVIGADKPNGIFQTGQYLKNSDLHIFLQNGVPEICAVVRDNCIDMLRAKPEQWYSAVSPKYLDILEYYIKANNFSLNTAAKAKIATAKRSAMQDSLDIKNADESLQ